MIATTRREHVLKSLHHATHALSASKLAQMHGVSRQVIVGDIALLRAAGEAIIATPKGYITQTFPVQNTYTVAVIHDASRTREELELLVSLGVTVLDVRVDHPLYGELNGSLNIHTTDDIDAFLLKDSPLLSTLTQGLHLHNLVCRDDAHFKTVKEALNHANFLYDN